MFYIYNRIGYFIYFLYPLIKFLWLFKIFRNMCFFRQTLKLYHKLQMSMFKPSKFKGNKINSTSFKKNSHGSTFIVQYFMLISDLK